MSDLPKIFGHDPVKLLNTGGSESVEQFIDKLYEADFITDEMVADLSGENAHISPSMLKMITLAALTTYAGNAYLSPEHEEKLKLIAELATTVGYEALEQLKQQGG